MDFRILKDGVAVELSSGFTISGRVAAPFARLLNGVRGVSDAFSRGDAAMRDLGAAFDAFAWRGARHEQRCEHRREQHRRYPRARRVRCSGRIRRRKVGP